MTRVAIWNIEQWGDRYGATLYDHVLEGHRKNLILSVIKDLKLDIVLFQEFRLSAKDYLKKIRKDLNDADPANNWSYDWIPGAVGSGKTYSSFISPPQFDKLDFTRRGFNEGYAVLWRKNLLEKAKWKCSHGENNGGIKEKGNNYISLSFFGAQPKYSSSEPAILPDGNNRTNNLGYPRRGCPQWVKKEIGEIPVDTTGQTLYLQEVRRPVVLQTTSNGNSVTILCYHAPNGDFSCYYGPFTGLLDEFVESGYCFFGGDWNIVGATKRGYVLDAGKQQGFGRNVSERLMAVGTTTQIGSMIHSYHNSNTYGHVWSDNTDKKIIGHHRDVGMGRRAFTQPTGFWNLSVKDVSQMPFENTDYFYSKYILNNIERLHGLIGEIPNNFIPQQAYNEAAKEYATPAVYIEKRVQNSDPNYSEATLYALIYQAFVSDHLPVIVQFP